MSETLAQAVAAARACTLCQAALPLGPRPVFRAQPSARLLIISQAPGTKAHNTSIPFNDASGVRLRDWLGIDATQFYDETRVAFLPMGFCYPGVLPRGGDKPPMPICAPTWHARLMPLLTNVRLTLLVGSHAQNFHLGRGLLTARVAGFRDYLPRALPLPHPSWRTLAWERRHPWFTQKLLPELRQRVTAALQDQ